MQIRPGLFSNEQMIAIKRAHTALVRELRLANEEQKSALGQLLYGSFQDFDDKTLLRSRALARWRGASELG